MAKAIELTDMTAPPVPRAAQLAPPPAPAPAPANKGAADKAKKEPLQVRWPREEVKAAKIASLQQGFPTVSDFMLACFHAYIKGAQKG
jgi:hypothetical protein